MVVDLFGQEVRATTAKRKERPNGYAARPGSGPKGKTCKGCQHYVRRQSGNGVYLKCALLERCWTHGYGTDIRAGSPACVMFVEVAA